VIETNIDDMNPQLFDHIMEKLLKMGAFDVFLIPVMMKKNRPGILLTVISPVDKKDLMIEFLLRETTTLGMRMREEDRIRAEREILTLNTPYGKVRFKIAYWKNEKVNLSPEYEDCKRIAVKKGIPLKDVFEEARKVAMKWFEKRA
ncbi:MAG: nickel insertion protein, partial [Thermodesulfobacteriota bacterium]